MQRTWELAMTGRYARAVEVLAQLEREGFAELAYWKAAVDTHSKIDVVCRASTLALARGLPEPEGGSDSAAIWHVIARETEGFWMRDFEAFSRCFLHSERFRFHASARALGTTIRDGWEPFARAVQVDIQCDPDPNPYLAYCTERTDRNLTILGDMAWCTFTAKFRTLDLEGFHGPGLTHDIRIFERHGGVWKCVLYGLQSIDFGQTSSPLWEIDRTGRVLQQNPAARRYLALADDVEIRDGRLRLREHAGDQKLTGAIASLAGIEYSFLTWRSALPVVIDAGYDLPRTVWWVIAEHGKLMVSCNDHPQLQARIKTAGRVFGLSPAQSRLAMALVEGLPLTDAARREEVSLGTAKTQLQRIYDKVGVRNQPALVRALLEVG